MRESVKILRAKLATKQCVAPEKSGYYTWWFAKEDKDTLIGIFNKYVPNFAQGVCDNDILQTQIDGRTYYALYFGIANKNLKERLKWHLGISPSHSLSAIKSDFLSTLRKSIAALLLSQEPMKLDEEVVAVNTILDRCYWEYNKSNDPKSKEKSELDSKKYIYPLNIAGNQGFKRIKGYSTYKVLTPLRRNHKKYHIEKNQE